jgi:5-methylcytosine-specific restriction endonuclease McrA
MSEYVPAELRRLIRERAGHRCEYCLLHEDDAFLPHEPDHIISVKHRGETNEGNLAWTCFVCNRGIRKRPCFGRRDNGRDRKTFSSQDRFMVRSLGADERWFPFGQDGYRTSNNRTSQVEPS